MPIYEYACPQCQKNFEEWLKSTDDAATHACPVCGTSSPRIISQTTFILKGGGWYVTEYGSHHAEAEEAPSAHDAPETKSDGAEAAAAPGSANSSNSPSPADGAGAKASPAPAAPAKETATPAPATAKTASSAEKTASKPAAVAADA